MNKNICKICGAALVIGLFALSSIGSAAVPQGQGQQVYHAGDYYEGSSYTVPSEWGWDSDETLPYPPPADPFLLGKPDLVVTRIIIHREDGYARFTIRVRNLGKTLGSGPSTAQVTVTKLGIPADNKFETIPTLIQIIGKHDIETELIPFDHTGGTVIASLDINHEIDEWTELNLRIRHFVGNNFALEQISALVQGCESIESGAAL